MRTILRFLPIAIMGCSLFNRYDDELIIKAERKQMVLRHFRNHAADWPGQGEKAVSLSPEEMKALLAGIKAQRYSWFSWSQPYPVWEASEIDFLSQAASSGLARIKANERLVFKGRDEGGNSYQGEIFIRDRALHFILWELRDDRFYLSGEAPDSPRSTWRLVEQPGQRYHKSRSVFREVVHPNWLEIALPELQEAHF